MTEKPKLQIISDSTFSQLNALSVKEYVEAKGNFDYFPWADAHQVMKEYDPDSEVKEEWFDHYEILSSSDGNYHQMITKKLPYQKTENSSFVVVTVIFKGKSEREIFPILDYRNQDITDPKMSQVNKALKRAFVKALAKHGLGLYIYRGEDLPSIPKITLKEVEKVEMLLEKINELVGQDTTQKQIVRLNAVIQQEHPELDPVEKIETMNKDQYGLLLRLLNKSKEKAEQNAKEQKA